MNSNDYISIVNEDNEFHEIPRAVIAVMGDMLGIY
jgi:hypothetical protein